MKVTLITGKQGSGKTTMALRLMAEKKKFLLTDARIQDGIEDQLRIIKDVKKGTQSIVIESLTDDDKHLIPMLIQAAQEVPIATKHNQKIGAELVLTSQLSFSQLVPDSNIRAFYTEALNLTVVSL